MDPLSIVLTKGTEYERGPKSIITEKKDKHPVPPNFVVKGNRRGGLSKDDTKWGQTLHFL